MNPFVLLAAFASRKGLSSLLQYVVDDFNPSHLLCRYTFEYFLSRHRFPASALVIRLVQMLPGLLNVAFLCFPSFLMAHVFPL